MLIYGKRPTDRMIGIADLAFKIVTIGVGVLLAVHVAPQIWGI